MNGSFTCRSGLGGALRAPLGPVAAPLASSLHAPSRPHPPRYVLDRRFTVAAHFNFRRAKRSSRERLEQ